MEIIKANNELEASKTGFNEIDSNMQAEQLKAQINACCILAERHPRDLQQVRIDILDACKNPFFAKMALYKKPVGGGTTAIGFSIHFAKLAIQSWGNTFTLDTITNDDESKRKISSLSMDVQRNNTYVGQKLIEKTVERKSLNGRNPIGSRANTKGETVYIVQATEDEFITKEASFRAKLNRDLWLRHIPSYILDEARENIESTLKDQYAKDPKAELNKICDAFNYIGIKPKSLSDYLDQELETISPAQIQQLREIYQAIKDGEATWKEFLDAKDKAESNKPDANKTKEENLINALDKKISKPAPQQQAKKLTKSEMLAEIKHIAFQACGEDVESINDFVVSEGMQSLKNMPDGWETVLLESEIEILYNHFNIKVKPRI